MSVHLVFVLWRRRWWHPVRSRRVLGVFSQRSAADAWVKAITTTRAWVETIAVDKRPVVALAMEVNLC